ncbi:WD40 repeat domain-containing protein [Actinomadura sp. K4S16]|uniref:WD40 repeat domain-containing protein n=1 Tax=Actinomadura sp. K4S16 TaxID=1316147 RepID=UPI0011ED4247|nr:WD40 repeat domain-containing protein [Actinomadura sp. K4S16]
MLTDDYGISVLDLDRTERRVRVRVFVVRYDIERRSHPPVPSEAAFFVRLLWETAADGDPIREEISAARIRDDAWLEQNSRWFVERVEGRDGYKEQLDGGDYGLLDGDTHYQRGDGWTGEFRFAQGDFDVRVPDPRWLHHLEPGLVLGSASRDAATEHLRPEDVPHLPGLRSPVATLTPFPEEPDEYDELEDPAVLDRLVFSDDSRYLAVTSEDGGLVVYETDGWTERARVHPGRDGLDNAMWVPGEHVIVLTDAYGIHDAEPWAYDMDAGAEVPAPQQAGHVRSRTGRYRVEFGEDGTVAFVTAPRTPDRTVPVGPDDDSLLSADAVAFDAAESRMFVCWGPNVYVLDPATGRALDTITAGVRRLGSVAASPDGAYIATAPHTWPGMAPWPARPEAEGREAGDEPSIWRVADGRPLLHCKLGLNIGALAWSPNGRWLAANTDGPLHPSDPVQTYVFRVPG